MKKLIFLLTVMLVSFSFINVSEARPKHKNYHYSKVHKNKVVKVAPVKPVATPVYDESTTSGYWTAEYNRNKPSVQKPEKIAKKVTKVTSKSVASNTSLVNAATRYVGATSNQLGLPRRLWCADFMNMLVGGTDRRAISYASRGAKADYGCVNCVAVTTRRGGAHVGVVSGYDNKGNPIIVSGNHNRRVGVAIYDKRRVVAYRSI